MVVIGGTAQHFPGVTEEAYERCSASRCLAQGSNRIPLSTNLNHKNLAAAKGSRSRCGRSATLI